MFDLIIKLMHTIFMLRSNATKSERLVQCNTKKTHLSVFYEHEHVNCNLNISKGILTETAKMIDDKTHRELIAQNDHVTVSMNKNSSNDLQISIFSTGGKTWIASASFRGPSVHVTYNPNNLYNSNSNNFKRFLLAACQHISCRRQFFDDTPHVFQHSLTSSAMLAHENAARLILGCSYGPDAKVNFDKPNVTLNLGMRYYKSFFHFNAKLIGAAVKAHTNEKYTLLMARGMILNTAVALCSSMPLQTKSNDSSCRNFMFHANTRSWIDGTCGLARKIETMLLKISSGALKPRFQLSCRTAGGVTKFPVYVLPRHAGAWAITISNQGVSIVLGHTCHNIVYASGCVKVPCCETNPDDYSKTVQALRCQYISMTAQENNLNNRQWASIAGAIIAESSCTNSQKNILSQLCTENTPAMHVLAFIGNARGAAQVT